MGQQGLFQAPHSSYCLSDLLHGILSHDILYIMLLDNLPPNYMKHLVSCLQLPSIPSAGRIIEMTLRQEWWSGVVLCPLEDKAYLAFDT